MGATVTILLPNDHAADRTAVPLGALSDEGKQAGVWVFDEKTSTVAFRTVRIDQVGAETAILSSGVSVGERIVALGAHLLHDGQRVRISDVQASLP